MSGPILVQQGTSMPGYVGQYPTIHLGSSPTETTQGWVIGESFHTETKPTLVEGINLQEFLKPLGANPNLMFTTLSGIPGDSLINSVNSHNGFGLAGSTSSYVGANAYALLKPGTAPNTNAAGLIYGNR